MRVCVLAGGVGSARLLAGLVRVLDPADVTVVVNTGDDERIRGLHISPDIDTVLYHLGDTADWERGWGVTGETWRSNDRYRELAGRVGSDGIDLQEWFALGDLDLAVHQLRAALLAAGRTLAQTTDVLRRAMGIGCHVLPVSDGEVRTLLRTAGGEVLDFQEYFVRRQQSEEIAAVEVVGDGIGAAAPGVLQAIRDAEIVCVPPSNPMLSIDPVLVVAGVREAVREAAGRRVAVSPIIGGKAVKGPAGALLRSLGHEVSALGVARIYAELLDVFVLDTADAALAPDVERLGMRPAVTDTLMRSAQDAARVAKAVIEAAS